MNVSVYAADDRVVFQGVANVCTDEHNNLEILGVKDKPLGLFNRDHWDRVIHGEEVDDGQ